MGSQPRSRSQTVMLTLGLALAETTRLLSKPPHPIGAGLPKLHSRASSKLHLQLPSLLTLR